MYQAQPDPYCYPGTNILKNKAGLTSADALEQFETAITFARSEEPLPAGRLSGTHYRAIHHHLFQDVYDWAGPFRTVRLAKGASTFCYPENIGREMRRLFDWLRQQQHLRDLELAEFARQAAHFVSELMQFIHFAKAMAGHSLPFSHSSRSARVTRSILMGSSRLPCWTR